MSTELRRTFPTDTRPTIVCLCGSSRFRDEFEDVAFALTVAGEIVLSIGFPPRGEAGLPVGEGVADGSVDKAALDEIHRRKIDLADYVLVIDADGYVGTSTASEIAYANERGIPVRHLSQGSLDERPRPAQRS